jgi:hypothetical protein
LSSSTLLTGFRARVSLIAGGVFVADSPFGFPPGAPARTPEELSRHANVHGIVPVVGFLSLGAACFVFDRRFAALGQRRWAAGSAMTGVVVLALSAWPNLGETQRADSCPLWVAMVFGFGWVSAVAGWPMTTISDRQA